MTESKLEDTPDITSTAGHVEAEARNSSQQPLITREPSSASSYANLNYLFGVQNPTMIAPKPSRNRRKTNQEPGHIKHKRTRSGCYTCRLRRVKCDEARPTCQRCKKGSRDCAYPPNSTSTKPSSSGSSKDSKSAPQESPGSSSDEIDEGAESERLEVIPDADEDLDSPILAQDTSKAGRHPKKPNKPLNRKKGGTRQVSETPSLVQDKGLSPTPSTEGSTGYAAHRNTNHISNGADSSAGVRINAQESDWAHLPPDLRFYLAYYCENVTHYHYALKDTAGTFLQKHLLNAALGNDALLYALVGFSAFQRTLHNPEGRIQDFLQYYNKAVSLLLHSLKKGEQRSNGMILAILQLATIEEYLGDWVNLLGHQKAALEILTELYTPQTVMDNELTRVMLGWYQRFDVFAGLMGGFQAALPREWFRYAVEYFQKRSQVEPENITWKLETLLANHRLLALDLSVLFAKQGKGEISGEEFRKENELVGHRISVFMAKSDQALHDPRHMVSDFNGAPPRDPADIVDPYVPGVLYSRPLFVMNLAKIDWYSIDLMHRNQTALTLGTIPPDEPSQLAFKICQLFEAVERWPGSPPGAILSCQASLAISSLFLPRDTRHGIWMRRKFATIECRGYIFPSTFRKQMASILGEPSVIHWWLPHDECYSPIIRTIRRFVEERTSPAKDVDTEDLHNIKAIFGALSLNGDSDVSSPVETQQVDGRMNVIDAAIKGSFEYMQGISSGVAYREQYEEQDGH